MEQQDILAGKRVLIVDDEADVRASLKEILEACVVEEAADFGTARRLIEERPYDAAILDIMGVDGYALLELTGLKGIPAVMLTAHALSPEDFIHSVRGGARAYVPKDRIPEIATFLKDALESHARGERGLGRWFRRLEAFFEKQFGRDWKERSDPQFWKDNYYL